MYYIVYIIFYLLSLIPLKLLYVMSDLLYIVIFKIWGYRTQVVTHQLQNCFPEKKDEEIYAIVKQYYKNMCDQIVETIKLASLSEKELNRRFYIDYDRWMPYFLENRNFQFWTAHFFNFEWLNHSFQLQLKAYTDEPDHEPFEYYAVYSSLGSKTSDRLFQRLRSVRGSHLVSIKAFLKLLPSHQQINAIGLVADQSPTNPRTAFWIDFFGINTAFYSLPERIAKERNMTVIFPQLIKVKRGYYQCKIKVLTETPQDFKRGQLTKLYAEQLEQEIREQTSLWMWSHRRWKRKYQAEYKNNRIT